VNERIEKLWTQAGGHYNSGNQHTWPQYTIDNPEKFAESLINECADIATINQFQHDPVGRFVREHFEVTGF